ncbi:ImuA family protein [Martelella mediterranea]|uniref:Protein ImuA n=1 Tax=Martelella mediterranea TaxID=293089 RepID=A0A4R3NYR5_9HYPH|nr:hypothetical protein [Martelella mediterranea]TCT45100.1 protein ImuA [Martelella mediterranea]
MTVGFENMFPLMKGRAHDVSGAGAFFFAAVLAGQYGGPVLWVRPAWFSDTINPTAYGAYANPDGLVVARTADQTETLSVGEEGLRSGAVQLVVLECETSLELTPGRRLQLSAEAGRSTCLCLFPENVGNQAATTRWRTYPLFDESDSTLQNWSLIKNKTGTNRSWTVRWDETSRRIHVVSEASERADFTPPPG